MKNIFKIFLIILLSLGIGYGIAKFNLVPNFLSPNKQESKNELYVCPMHPTYTSDRPGDCPICGMRLVKKERKEGSGNATIVERKMKQEGAFKLEIDPDKQQYIGIKVTKTIKKDAIKEIKALGTIVPDETKLAHIHTKFSGFIHHVFADYEGKLVEKDQPLFTVYSPELVSTQEEYLLALEAEKKLKGNKFPEIDKAQSSLLQAAKRRLELWDISSEQIDNLRETKQVTKELTFYSPVNGFITKREAFEGTEIKPDTTLYDIVDLSKVWVFVEVYEVDLPLVMIGQSATVHFQYGSEKPFIGKITYISPVIEPTTRTTKVRLEVNNPGYKLKPDMYVDAVILSDIGSQVVVPTRAVIDSGERKIVFVKSGKGEFTPQEVELGPEINDERVIYSGINEGDEVVTDGNFLLDSESNLETALQQMKTLGGHAGHMM